MQRVMGAVAGTVLSLALCGTAAAQQKIEWKQTTNTPKGLNLPSGMQADILGIAPGDSYPEAKSKLEKLLAETGTKPSAPMSAAQRDAADMMGESQAPPLSETNSTFRLQTPGASAFVSGEYVSQLELKRRLPGTGRDQTEDTLRVRLSAPSSAQQVLAVDRYLNYSTQVVADQPSITEVLGNLKAKFGPNPWMQQQSSSVIYIFQFDNGRMVGTPDLNCREYYSGRPTGIQAQDVPRINQTGTCDVILRVEFNYGISKDRAKSIAFTLADNERAKANITTDFAFMDAFVRGLQVQKGAAPKL